MPKKKRNMSNYLEIDSNILEKNLLLKSSSTDASNFENLLCSSEKCVLENTPWKLAKPTPGFCVKTVDSKNKKVFINICQLDDIPEPKDITEAQLLELWQSDDIPDYRIPLSIQEPHDEFDKSGRPTTAYDIAVNTKFFQKIQANFVFRSFVIQVVLEGIENKYDVVLKKEGFVILQNRKCLGELKAHRIRIGEVPGKPVKPLIEELHSTNEALGSGGMKMDKTETYKVPQFRFFENSRRKLLIGEFYLPKIATFKDINLDLNEDRVILEGRRGSYLADVFTPFHIDETQTTAQFNSNSKILTVKMPILLTM